MNPQSEDDDVAIILSRLERGEAIMSRFADIKRRVDLLDISSPEGPDEQLIGVFSTYRSAFDEMTGLLAEFRLFMEETQCRDNQRQKTGDRFERVSQPIEVPGEANTRRELANQEIRHIMLRLDELQQSDAPPFNQAWFSDLRSRTERVLDRSEE